MNQEIPKILCLDTVVPPDGPLPACLAESGYGVELLPDLQAVERCLASQQRCDAVVLPLECAEDGGLRVFQRSGRLPGLRALPIVLVQQAAARSTLARIPDQGHYQFLVEACDGPMLGRGLAQALAGRGQVSAADVEGTTGSPEVQCTAGFAFRTLQGVHQVAALLAAAFPQPERALVGLTELLLNAVEHGNLDISYAQKSRLQAEGRWHAEIEARLAHPDYADRAVRVEFVRAIGYVRVLIEDQGAGFDWRPYLEIDPGRMTDLHGRGIALARMIGFDTVVFLGSGNRVEVTAAAPP